MNSEEKCPVCDSKDFRDVGNIVVPRELSHAEIMNTPIGVPGVIPPDLIIHLPFKYCVHCRIVLFPKPDMLAKLEGLKSLAELGESRSQVGGDPFEE